MWCERRGREEVLCGIEKLIRIYGMREEEREGMT